MLSESQKKQYNELHASAKASIHRHEQVSIAQELNNLSKIPASDEVRDSYGQGGGIGEFEHHLCDLFGKNSCVFLPTGTLAQCVALKCYSESSGRSQVGLHPTSHLLLHEHMAIETLWRLQVTTVGEYERVLTATDLTKLDPTTLAAIIIELPMRELGGALPSWDDLMVIKKWCKQYNVKMHLDGARIWQTTQYYKCSLANIASLFDSIYISFYKDLGGISGAALLADEALISQARIWARRAGGNPITLYPEVLSARAGLEKYLPKMDDFVDYTKKLSAALRPLPIKIVPATPEVAMFHIQFDMNAEALTNKIISYAEQTDILVLPLPRSSNAHSCVCEITIGDQAIAHEYQFWVDHINACLDA
jgi:threonine aldolase